MEQIVRAIYWFSRRNNRLIGEEKIKNFNLDKFKLLFKHTDIQDPNMYGGDYEISEIHVHDIQQFIQHKINLDKFYYFFTTYNDK